MNLTTLLSRNANSADRLTRWRGRSETAMTRRLIQRQVRRDREAAAWAEAKAQLEEIMSRY